MIKLSNFTWSNTEQVYPFEKSVTGETLYCKEVNMGTLVNNGYKEVSIASTIPGLTVSKLFRTEAFVKGPTDFMPSSVLNATFLDGHGFDFASGNMWIRSRSDLTNRTGIIRAIYSK